MVAAAAYRTRHGCKAMLCRHAHAGAFAAVVLSGRYEEAGDTGVHLVEAGDVVVHESWESHIDRFGHAGAEVLVVPLGTFQLPFVHGRIDDADAIARQAAADPRAALAELATAIKVRPGSERDWPALLATALRADPERSIRDWAMEAGLHFGSVSRGFRQVFGITPKGYRLKQRTLRATAALGSSDRSLAGIASDCRFADQSHMTRAIKRATTMTPRILSQLSAP